MSKKKYKTDEQIKWELYEIAKQDLKAEHPTQEEYNRRIKIIIRELKL